MTKTLTSVELFTGAGGLALGTAHAGFRHRLLVEFNADACNTLRLNRDLFGGAECQIHEGDVRALDLRPFAGVDLLAAGAPCQPFSIGGKHRAHEDERNLFPEVFRAVRAIQPRAVLVENVRGLLRPALSEFVEYIELQLAHPTIEGAADADWPEQLGRLREVERIEADDSALQYRVHRVLVNAADYGVPQRRQRVFFVAIRADEPGLWSPPSASHSEHALRIAQTATGDYWRSHGMKRKTMPTHPALGEWSAKAGKRERWQTVRDALAELPEPVDRVEHARYANHIGQPGARSYPGHTGSPLDEPAKTLKAGVHGVPGGENMLRRPNGSVRYFTVREAARLQTFPDEFVFAGAWGEAMRQIGNAVPPKLAEAVARSIAQCLLEAPRSAKPRRPRSPALAQGVLPGL